MAKEIYSTLGEMFGFLRLAKGKTQGQIAASIQSTQKTISDTENNAQAVTFETVRKLKDYYRIKIIWDKEGFTYRKIR